jgi:TRAP-type transport system periplasmic protein
MNPSTPGICRLATQIAAPALLVAALGTFGASGQGADEYPEMNLRAAQGVGSTGFASETLQWWADEIERRTDGRVKIEIFWGGSLIAWTDIPAAVAGGAVDIGHVPSTYDPARTRLWMTLDMPFNVRDHWCAVYAGRQVTTENEHLAAELEKNNMVPLVGYNSGFQQYIAADPIPTLKDLEGRRLRSYGGARVRLHEALGITPVFMAFGEIYAAIERGVLDGSSDIAIYLGNVFKLHEVANHFLVTGSGAAVAAPFAVMNKEVWDGLPENLQTLILEVSDEHDQRFARALIAAEEELLKQYEDDPNIHVYYLSDEDQAAMEAAARKVQDEWIAEAEAEGLAARDVWEHFQRLQSECEADVAANGYPWAR